jgi:hypothetical protein
MDKYSLRRHYETLAKHEYNKRMLELELQSYDEPEMPLPDHTPTEAQLASRTYNKKLHANNRAGVALKLERVKLDIEYLHEAHLLSLKGV